MAERPSMPAIYAALAEDETRNDLIFDDVLKSLEARGQHDVTHERRQVDLVCAVCKHPLDEIGMPSDPLWRYDAHLGKMASQGVHKHCSLADQ